MAFHFPLPKACFVAGAIAAVIAGPAEAQTGAHAGTLAALDRTPARTTAVAETTPPAEREAGAFVTQLGQRVATVMADETLSQEDKVERFRQIFVEAIDLPVVGRFVLGRNWAAATEEQRRAFLSLFEEITVRTWAERFQDYSTTNGYTTDPLNVTGVEADGETGVIVHSVVERPQGQPIPVSWRLRRPDGGYKIVDIVVEGVSMAITYRSDYTSALRASGGRIEGLLDLMRKKVALLGGNATAKAN